MRSYMSLALAFALGMAVFAAATPSLTATAQPPTRIEADQAAHAIRFMVDGREEGRIDKEGLHVREGVEHGGALTDVGEAFYDKPGKPEPKH